jgi:hypothetical protein
VRPLQRDPSPAESAPRATTRPQPDQRIRVVWSGSPRTCGYCHDALGGEWVVACPRCGGRMHADCARLFARCASFACLTSAPPSRRDGSRRRPPRGILLTEPTSLPATEAEELQVPRGIRRSLPALAPDRILALVVIGSVYAWCAWSMTRPVPISHSGHSKVINDHLDRR